MVKKVEFGEAQIVGLLSEHPEGLDIYSITKKLNADIRSVKPLLLNLQEKNKISSGLKKITGKFSCFDRHYFIL